MNIMNKYELEGFDIHTMLKIISYINFSILLNIYIC